MKFNFEATGIGSVPFKDAQTACDIILKNFPAIPFWPQLARKGFLENMYVQFSEKLPGLILDDKNKKIEIDAEKAAAGIESVYERYLADDVEFFKISENYAAGFYEFLRMCSGGLPPTVKFVKGHITGPISYALSLTTQDKKSILYDTDMYEVLTKVLVMKARWQIRKLKSCFPKVIIFIDEPSLVSIGSSYVNINPETAFEKLDELIKAIKDEGALCGLHCCGNTDWPLLLKRDIDILSFDAYNFTKEMLLYSAELKEFFRRGSALAWGVVPTGSDAIKVETAESIADKLRVALNILPDKGIEKDSASCLVTPSCGVGTLDESLALKVFESAKRVSELIQD
ncbi:MAG: hypothetical protein WCY36_03860 [Candidatus Omnitrophota bacterium]